MKKSSKYALDSTTSTAVSENLKTKPLDKMMERDWRIFREDNDIQVNSGKVPLPIRAWREANFPEQVLENLEYLGYSDPLPI